MQTSPLKKLFNALRNKEVVDARGPMIHHLIDHVDLRDDGLPPGDLHQGSNVADCQTNQEVHDNDREQQDICSKEEVGSA